MRFSGAALAEHRRAAGLTREQLAMMVGRSYNTVVSWEVGRQFPNVTMLPELADALSCSVPDLFRGDHRPERIG